MKDLKFLGKVLICMLMCLNFVACSDDDNDFLAFDSTTIIGQWVITDVQGSSEWSWISKGETMTFNADGTCITGHWMENVYRIEDGCIHTYNNDSGEPMFIYTLIENKGSKLSVKVQGTLDESNSSVVIKKKKNI